MAGGSRQALLSRALQNPGIVAAALGQQDAKRVGELLRETRTADVADAHVAVLAVRLRAPVVTSDPDDITGLSPGAEIVRV